ncbi:hypothetical protein ACJIZ3_007700 [Penstemon smallii]|uniref:Dihydroflavonol 4-reductase n=1 Tax=Penstemon smallii TaxID=265156 RepID=A0ABD3T7P5_9LAMI
MEVVCVTGASGYVASWLVKLLLDHGYTVKATVRNLNCIYVEEGSFDSIVDGCQCVFHTASPVILKVSDPQAELMEPAIKGTLNVLESCKKVSSSSIKRVVITSSTAAVMTNRNPTGPGVIIDETWFSDPEFCQETEQWYNKSKVLAEKAGWKFAEENGIDLVVMNPGFVLGPLLQPTLNFTSQCVLSLVKGEDLFSEYPFVDVRDVAYAHLLAFENPLATGRYCLVGSTVKYGAIVNILHKFYPSLNIQYNGGSGDPTTFQVSKKKAESLGVKFTPLESVSRTLLKKLFLLYSLAIAIAIAIAICSCSAQTNHVKCLPSDQKALLDIKNGFNDPENTLSSWHGLDCCKWRGIFCHNITGSVITIDLHNRNPRYGFWNLSGEISPSLANLESLKNLDLSFNTFREIPIPEFISSLKNLQYLNLSNAGFGGVIPPNLGNLTNLQYLDVSSLGFSTLIVDDFKWVDLSFNSFTSFFPNWLVNISSLVYIDLRDSMLRGRIPLGLSELHELRFLNLGLNHNLSANGLSLFHGTWEKIEVLDLSSNKVHGKLPQNVGNMTTLTDFNLFDNELEGGIPRTIGSLCKLVNFDVSGNKMRGTLPEILEGVEKCRGDSPLPSLVNLRLSNNELTGPLPYWLGQLKNLEDLSLSYNSIEGPIPNSLNGLQNLTQLSLAGNKLNGTLPESIGELSNIDFSSNLFDGYIPIPSVEVELFDLSNNRFEGPIPQNISETMPDLIFFSLSGNKLTGKIPDDIGNMASLQVLDFSSNNLFGSIPNSLGNCSYLKALDLGNNSLSGSIPNSIGKLKQLRSLHLNDNLFSGKLPFSLNNLSSLETLDLGHNMFEDTLASWFGQGFALSSLRILRLRSNAFLGGILIEFSNLSSLQILDLSENNFTGLIPTSLGDLKAMAQEQTKNDVGLGFAVGILVPYILLIEFQEVFSIYLVTSAGAEYFHHESDN